MQGDAFWYLFDAKLWEEALIGDWIMTYALMLRKVEGDLGNIDMNFKYWVDSEKESRLRVYSTKYRL